MSSDLLDLSAAKELRKRLDAPPPADLSRNVERAVAVGRGLSWVSGLVRAARGAGKLSVGEFFYYGLCEPERLSDTCYVGKRVQHRLHTACNNSNWHALCHDKAIFYTALSGAGLPIPKTIAVFDKRGRQGCFGSVLRSAADLRAFLSDPSNYPMFAKPVDGIYSIGALYLAGIYENVVTLPDGTDAGLDHVIEFVEQLTSEGYLFQKILQPAHTEAFGNALVAARLLILMGEEPRLESAVLKIPRVGNVADNFWRGNMLAALRPDEGSIYRVVSGHGADLEEIETHPDTGVDLLGLQIQEWPELVDLCMRAATMFPGIRTQSWDVALTSNGPILLELNFGGDLNLHQLAHGRGILTDSYVSHLRKCGYKGRLT